MSFNPNPQSLKLVCDLFRELQGHNNQRHQEILKKLTELEKNDEFNCHLAFVFANLKNEPEQIRSQAGIKLKNNIRSHYTSMHPFVQNYVKNQAFTTIADSSKLIRNICGTIITTIAEIERLTGWGPHLQQLVRLLENQNPLVVEGAFDALAKICEDMPTLLDSEELGRPLNVMIPKFISFFFHPKENIRRYAVASVAMFIPTLPQALIVHLPKYVEGLLKLTGDGTSSVRKLVCHTLVALLDVDGAFDHLNKHMQNLFGFIISVIRDSRESDELVALEACAFWPAYCHSQHTDLVLLKQSLPHLVPVLLAAMRYNQMDIAVLTAGNDDEPDRPEDLKPRHHKKRGLLDDEDRDEGEVGDWNLRKCAALSLDRLSGALRGDLWAVLQPMMPSLLENRDWRVREAGVLALGAVADGCYEGIERHSGQLVPYLLNLAQKDEPLVRSIACWTLSRFSGCWILAHPDEKYLRPFLGILFDCMVHPNKRVQEASCSAFATLVEEAQERMTPYVGVVVPKLVAALARYQTKNLMILYDAIGTLAEAVGSALNQPQILQMLMPPIMHKWSAMKDDDRSCFAFLECIAALAQALGQAIVPFVGPIIGRCMHMLHRVITQHQHAVQVVQSKGEAEFPDKEFAESALDLMAALVDVLKGEIARFIPDALWPMLFHSIQDDDPAVRQSALALLGELARARLNQLRPHVSKYIAGVATSLEPELVAVCNNASWCIGEITAFINKDMAPYIANLLDCFVPVITSDHANPGLLENVAITLGRLGLVSPNDLAAKFDKFGERWCFHMSRVRDPRQKVTSFGGLCLVLERVASTRPQLLRPCVPILLAIIAYWHQPPPETIELSRKLLAMLRGVSGNEWKSILSTQDPALLAQLNKIMPQ